MDMFLEDYQKMVPQMASGIITNATFQSLTDDSPNEEFLAAQISKHTTQVILHPQVLRKILGL